MRPDTLTPTPLTLHEIPPDWLPEIQETAHRYQRGTAHRVEVTIHRDDAENLAAQLQDNIGPALGWYSQRVDRKTVAVIPEQDLPLMEMLSKNPAGLVRDLQFREPRTERPERLVNVEIDQKYQTGGHGVAISVLLVAGVLTTFMGTVGTLSKLEKK